MPLDVARLRAFRIPEVREAWSRRDSAFYALSLGLGQDPLDEGRLAYCVADAAMPTVPTMALVMAHPGFWIGDPASGIDPASALHGEQTVACPRPLPCEGTFVSRTAVTDVVDKGPGRAAILYSETVLVDEATGETAAVARRTTFLRGQGGFGDWGAGHPPASPPAPYSPEGPPAHVVDLPTRPEAALLYALNGDDNPLHTRPEAARAGGFRAPILHGLCTMGVVAHALLRACAGYDPARIAGLGLRFTAPVHPGETIRTEIWPDGAFRARVVERDLVVVDGGRADLRG